MPFESEHNFNVEIYPRSIVKTASILNPFLLERLRRERTGLLCVQSIHPELIPRFNLINEWLEEGIIIERVNNLGKVPIQTIIQVIEKLQEIKVPEDANSYSKQTYLENLGWYADFLTTQGSVSGLSISEATIAVNYCKRRIDAIEFFDTTFVHTDIQDKHVGFDDDHNPKVIDFDQAHFGNELEDFAFLSIRHPKYERAIKKHLRDKFRGDENKSKHFDEAFNFFQNYFLLKGCYDRTNQVRGNSFDIVAKLYGRAMLSSSISQMGRKLLFRSK